METCVTGIDAGQRAGRLPLAVLPGDVNKPTGNDGLTAERHPGAKFG